MRVYQYMYYVLLKHNLIRKLTAVLILLNPPGTLYFCYKGHFLEHEEQYIATLSQEFFPSKQSPKSISVFLHL